MNIYLSQLAHYLPERRVSNEELINSHGLRMKPGWVEKIIGITERRWASPEEATSDLALKACEKLELKNFHGPLFLSTITGDFLTPSTSSILKQKLGIKNDLPGFDINAACAGLLFALDLGQKYLQSSEQSEALIMASECRSRFANPKDRRTIFLFGDGASAFVITKAAKGNNLLEWVLTKTEASEDYEIFIPGGGTREPLTNDSLENSRQYIKMNDGSKISELTTSRLIATVHETLEAKKQKLNDFDHFIFHQGNGRLIQAIAKEMGIEESKVWINFPQYGNSSSASVGISLSEASGQIKDGERVLLMAMGAGYHIGLASILWGEA